MAAAASAAGPASSEGVHVGSSLSMKDFKVGPTIGTGTFSRVFVATHTATGKVWAIKRLQKAECVRLQQTDHVQSERAILKEMEHPFIVALRGTFQDARHAYFVLEFVQGGELFMHIRKAGRLSNETSRFYLAQLVLALEALHKRSIIYRDVKPENLVLDTRGYIRLVDFGFAKRVAFKTYTLCGTPEYVAPEMLLNRGHDRGVDWWGAGILLYEMLAGQPPFIDDDPMGVYGQIIEGRILFPKYLERGARSLIRHLLQPDPSKRYGCLRRGAADVREHRFFTGVDWDAIYGRSQEAPILPSVDHATDVAHFDPYPDSDEEAIMPVYEGEDPFAAF